MSAASLRLQPPQRPQSVYIERGPDSDRLLYGQVFAIHGIGRKLTSRDCGHLVVRTAPLEGKYRPSWNWDLVASPHLESTRQSAMKLVAISEAVFHFAPPWPSSSGPYKDLSRMRKFWDDDNWLTFDEYASVIRHNNLDRVPEYFRNNPTLQMYDGR
jgi:hypothetical protein